jgi:small-conductance mechanosensitive channel
MGKSILVSVLVAIGCALIVLAFGRLLDSQTLSSLAVAAGAGAGIGYFITTRTSGNKGKTPR